MSTKLKASKVPVETQKRQEEEAVSSKGTNHLPGCTRNMSKTYADVVNVVSRTKLLVHFLT